MDSVTIQCKGIRKSYGQKETRIEALKDINISVEDGKLTLLVGPSGSGKTTLLSIITTILTPDAGQLFLLGQEVNKFSDNDKAKFCQKNLGIVFQSLFLIPTLSVLENVTLPLLVAGMKQRDAEEKSLNMLKTLNILNRAETSPASLSKGQQQRVAIARAMVNDAQILVCDEPTSALDQTAGLEIMSILKELALQALKTVLVVTHDHRIFHFANEIIHISDGLIVPGEKDG